MATDASRALPEFAEVEISSLPDGTTFEDLKSLQTLYREHCEVKGTYVFVRITTPTLQCIYSLIYDVFSKMRKKNLLSMW